MALGNVPGQERTRRLLKQMVRQGNIPHAILFSGMAGIGKLAVAREFAKVINCLNPRDDDCCDECNSCRKINDGHHPDVIPVQSDGTFIKLDQIKELRERVRFRPFEGKFRIIIIQEAHKLKEEAGNALLKLLEEPPKHNVFILTALEPQMLLSTIVSRCCHVRLQPLDDAWILRHLTDSFQVKPELAQALARLSGGSIERAERLAEGDQILHWKEIVERLQSLDHMDMIDFFLMTAQWAQKKEDLEQDLECVKLWVRDLLLSRLIGDYSRAFGQTSGFSDTAGEVSAEDLFRLYDEVEEAITRLRQNANRQLILEGVCLAIKDVIYGKSCWHSLS